MPEHAFLHDRLKPGYSGKQTYIRDDLNLYLCHMQMEKPKKKNYEKYNV